MKLKLQPTLFFISFLSFSALSQELAPSAKSSESPDKANVGSAKQSGNNKAEGEAFLAQNAKQQGITTLPNGLQYRIIQAGAGGTPATNDLVFVKYRGHLIDGTEFSHHNRFLTRVNEGIKGWQEALRRMKVGSKWQIFVPPALAFGDEGEPVHHIGPDSTLIYELELTSIAPPNPELGTGGLGHGLDENSSR
jgi:FKBP-type peptidyl-prolyl cis-trans isomerase